MKPSTIAIDPKNESTTQPKTSKAPRIPNNLDPRNESPNVVKTLNSLDPDLQSYFYVNQSSLERASPNVERDYRDTSIKSPTAVSQKSLNTQRSQGSKKSKDARTRRNSIASVMLMYNKYRDIAEWNERNAESSPEALTPYSFESSRHPSDPPRAPKVGQEWVWFPEGYWAEREVRDVPVTMAQPQPSPRWWNRSSPEKSKKTSVDSNASNNPSQRIDLPEIKIAMIKSPPSLRSLISKSSRRASKTEGTSGSKKGPFEIFKTDSVDTIETQKSQGFYCRTKQSIRKRFRLRKSPQQVITRPVHSNPTKIAKSRTNTDKMPQLGSVGWGSRTTTVLEGASNYFAQREGQQRLYNSTSTLHSPLTPGGRTYYSFGRAPWHRRNSHDSMLSVASSVHMLLMGKTPAATPVPEQRYIGQDGKTFPRVEISSADPQEPTFLPSEARRINTPPMSPGTATIGARGFFFDLGLAKEEEASRTVSPISPATSGGSANTTQRNLGKSATREWWEADSKHKEAGNKSSRQVEKGAIKQSATSAFELSLPPEHLPSSPLCPKNPLHPSGGTEFCAFHGRRRSVGLKAPLRVNSGTTNESGITEESSMSG